VAAAGQRAPFLPTWSETVLGVIGAGACAVLVVAVAARVIGPRPDRDRTLFLLSVLAWMAVGVLSGSFHFFPWGLDRYYLPLLVPAIGLAVVALPQPRRTTRLAALAAAPVLAACAVLAVGGTHDSLTVLSAVWRTADSAVYDLHIPDRHVDGGAAWSGWNVGDTAVQLTSPEYAKTPVVGGRWWIQIFAPGIDGRYLVSVGQVVDGYDVVRARRCDLWLQTGGCTVYLLHQRGTPP
jgi:hypothetical protein